MACSGLHLEREPPPDAALWRSIEDRRERLRTGLAAIYAWFERNAELIASVLRDAEVYPLAKEISQLRFGPFIAAWHEVLGAKLAARQRPMLALALSFHTWRTLVHDGGLKQGAAVKAMVQAIEGAGES